MFLSKVFSSPERKVSYICREGIAMPTSVYSFTYDMHRGLLLAGLLPTPAPVRVVVAGSGVFYVWGSFGVNSGEDAPAWADPALRLTLFGSAAETPEVRHSLETLLVDGAPAGYRAQARHPRVTAELELRDEEEGVRLCLTLANPQPDGGLALPVCQVELQVNGLRVGADDYFTSALPYGGRTFPVGRVAELGETGAVFTHGCIGLMLPLVYLHDRAELRGVEFELLSDGRPQGWLRPSAEGTRFALHWALARLLAPGQAHAFGGGLGLRPYTGRPVAQLRRWRDQAAARYGFTTKPIPARVRHSNALAVYLNERRLDDPAWPELMLGWQAMGFNSLFGIAPNHTLTHALSPVDYDPCEQLGGTMAERQWLEWVHALGMTAYLWVTTVGLDRDAPPVLAHADWWTHRADGSLFYAWDSTPASGYVGYAPDADPLSAGWRAWLTAQTGQVMERGWDGVGIDGCIPRADNHAVWDWPGRARNAVSDQVIELMRFARAQRADAVLYIEDGSLAGQTAGAVVTGRYGPGAPPRVQKTHWDLGMGGAPEPTTTAPPHIAPELARLYLALRWAGFLPGAVANDNVEGYTLDINRPWVASSILSGMLIYLHATTVRDVETWRPIAEADDPNERERDPAYRARNFADFFELARFVLAEPTLVRDAPRSLDGVLVTGDDAVVGILRPQDGRCLLALLQFADRPATVQVRLAAPDDVCAAERALAGHPQYRAWTAREALRCSAEESATPDGIISGEEALSVTIAPFSYRVFVLEYLTG